MTFGWLLWGQCRTQTWISAMWAFFWPKPMVRIWVWASTRMTVQCFFSCSSSASMLFLPSVYFLAYLLNAFFLLLYLHSASTIGHAWLFSLGDLIQIASPFDSETVANSALATGIARRASMVSMLENSVFMLLLTQIQRNEVWRVWSHAMELQLLILDIFPTIRLGGKCLQRWELSWMLLRISWAPSPWPLRLRWLLFGMRS